MREAFRNGILGQTGGMVMVGERFFPQADGEEDNGKKPKCMWVVLVARHRILTASDQEVRQELDDLLGVGTHL